jgi:hypothetical protein
MMVLVWWMISTKASQSHLCIFTLSSIHCICAPAHCYTHNIFPVHPLCLGSIRPPLLYPIYIHYHQQYKHYLLCHWMLHPSTFFVTFHSHITRVSSTFQRTYSKVDALQVPSGIHLTIFPCILAVGLKVVFRAIIVTLLANFGTKYTVYHPFYISFKVSYILSYIGIFVCLWYLLMYVCIYISVCIYICIYVYMHIYMNIYI